MDGSKNDGIYAVSIKKHSFSWGVKQDEEDESKKDKPKKTKKNKKPKKKAKVEE